MGFYARPTMTDLKVLGAGAPTSAKRLHYASGMMTLYSIVGRIGTTEVAAVNVLINLMLFLVLPCMGRDRSRRRRHHDTLVAPTSRTRQQWPWDVAKITAALMSVVAHHPRRVPTVVLAIFLNDPHAVDIAVRTPHRRVSHLRSRPALRLVSPCKTPSSASATPSASPS